MTLSRSPERKTKKSKKRKKDRKERKSKKSKKISRRIEKMRTKKSNRWSKSAVDLSKMTEEELGNHFAEINLINFLREQGLFNASNSLIFNLNK